MKDSLRCYCVRVKTTNALMNVTTNCWRESEREKAEYFDCEDGILYVVTDDPKKIYDKFGAETVLSIENCGVGYIL